MNAFENTNPWDRESDLVGDLAGALVVGMRNMRVAGTTSGMSDDVVSAVFEAAFNPLCDLSARKVDGYQQVLELALAVNGWAWTEACLVDPAHRLTAFKAVHRQAMGYSASHFPTLHKHERLAVVDDLLYFELSGAWIYSTTVGAGLPGWMILGIVFERLRWRLLDAKRRRINVISLDQVIEEIGELHSFIRPMWDIPVEESGVEAAVWAAARMNLAKRADDMISGARAGAPRAKVALSVEAARWVLTRGAEDSITSNGEPGWGSAEEVRRTYSQDPLLVCFRGMRAAAPATWGGYPEAAVPTREVIARIAAEAEARRDLNSSWFACLEARRVEVAKSDRVLHGVRRLVEALIKDAARDTR